MTKHDDPRQAAGLAEILEDLSADDVLDIQPGERLWKLYCFRKADEANGLRHRIYTKKKADGRLALVTFAAHNPVRVVDGLAQAPRVRSNLARVPDLSEDDLNRVIVAIQAQSASTPCETIDLSRYDTVEEQLMSLEHRISSR